MSYLSILKDQLRLGSEASEDLIRELRGHLEDKAGELHEAGMSEEEASEIATKLLGSPRIIAQQIYEVYSQGSWKQTIFAVLPHFLTAVLFALHLWSNPVWLVVLLTAVIGTVIYGWSRGKPTWLFSWLGFLLVPVIAAGFMLLYLPGGWAWIAALVYVPLAIFILVVVAKQILKIDWLFVSLMVLPVPIVLGWVMVLSAGGDLSSDALHEAAAGIALSFAVLALAVATFIRVRKRWIKAGALLICSIMVLVVVALVSNNTLGIGAWIFLSLLAVSHLFVPALLERRVRSRLKTDN